MMVCRVVKVTAASRRLSRLRETLERNGDTVVRDLATARSFLFVPGSKPERFQKAVDTGADWVVLDLEDAVAPADKGYARSWVNAWLGQCANAVVRVNPFGTPWHAGDIDMVMRHGCPVMIPKVESPADVESVRQRLQTGVALIPLIESAAAVLGAETICAQAGVIRISFGSFDFSAELGLDPENRAPLLFTRSLLVLASAAAGVAPPLDGVTGNVVQIEPLQADIEHARALGFGGKLCIHPKQVMHVNVGFTPTASEVQWAKRVLTEAGDAGVAVVDGKMIDAPVLARARRTVALAGEH